MQKISPLTGKLTNYIQITTNVVTSHFATPPTATQVVDAINWKFQTEGRDAICTDVLIVQGVLSDTVHPDILVSEAEAGTLETRSFFIWQLIALIAAVLILMGSAVIMYSVIKYINENKYAPPEDSGGTGLWTWEQEVSWLKDHYWYVCYKDLTVIGDKSLYGSPTDVPQAEVDWFNDHCSNANTPDISPKGGQDLVNYVIYGAVIIATIYVVAKILPTLLSKKTSHDGT